MPRLRFAERWARLGAGGEGLLVLVILAAISLAGWWMAFEPARDPGGCVSIAARGSRGLRSCEPSDIAWHILFSVAVGTLFGFLALRLITGVLRELMKPLPAEPLGAALRLLLNLQHIRLRSCEALADGLQLEFLRLGRDGTPNAAFRLRLSGLQRSEFHPDTGAPRDFLPLLRPGASLRFSPALRMVHPQHAQIAVSIAGQRFDQGHLVLRAQDYRLEPLALDGLKPPGKRSLSLPGCAA